MKNLETDLVQSRLISSYESLTLFFARESVIRSVAAVLPVLALLLAFMGAIVPAGARPLAPTINVTANAPDILNGTDGSCSLREAITNINNGANTYADCAATRAYGTSDSINLPAGTYTNAIPGLSEDLNATGDLDILKSVTISGAGASSTIIDGGARSRLLDRVFHINTSSGNAVVNISGVTIQNGTGSTIGSQGFSLGGGLYNASGTVNITYSILGGNTAGTKGGGLYNASGTVNITYSTISGNDSIINGGGIYNSTGFLTVTNSTISGNLADIGGGGIYNDRTGFLTVTNSTISGNRAYGRSPFGSGGGIYNDSVGIVDITNSTISGNLAFDAGGISNAGPVFLKNTIVANQVSGADCLSVISSTLNNLDSDGSCGVGALSNVAPLLGSLANNGGSTKTHALLPGSPAIDAGDAFTCGSSPVNGFDQRAIHRPQGAGCDIGAFELVPPTTCIKSGYVPRVTVKPGTANSIIFLRTSSLASSYKTFTTTDTKLLKAAVKSLPGRTYVKIKGNADCSTINSGGAAQYVIVAP